MYEVCITIEKEAADYVDSLIIALVRMGYEVYLDYDKEHICFVAPDEEVTKTGDWK